MELARLPVDEFCEVTASNTPAPGGGSVSALCGALAASLSTMVAKLTIGRKGYETVEADMQAAIIELERTRQVLLKAIDKDAAAFNDFMAAVKLPQVTDDEKLIRTETMQVALKKATQVPLQVAREAVKIFDYARLMIDSGNINAVTDAMVSAMTARTAALGALLNVRINLGSINDSDFLESTLFEVNTLEEQANEAEDCLLNAGYLLLSAR
ncbi:MAG: cyclodeaminase/cyclohydrolase family protein [Burkholderiaceae bacterium]|nr:cyclodeaminase/cyclohydrolase family protein [Burkholderiaceae bacterium]